jgi:hypothetical protein
MRGDDVNQRVFFSYISPEERVPKDHPLRPLRDMVDGILAELSGRFEEMYSSVGMIFSR